MPRDTSRRRDIQNRQGKAPHPSSALRNRQRGKQYPGAAGLGMYRPEYGRFRGYADGFAYLKKTGAFKTKKHEMMRSNPRRFYILK